MSTYIELDLVVYDRKQKIILYNKDFEYNHIKSDLDDFEEYTIYLDDIDREILKDILKKYNNIDTSIENSIMYELPYYVFTKESLKERIKTLDKDISNFSIIPDYTSMKEINFSNMDVKDATELFMSIKEEIESEYNSQKDFLNETKELKNNYTKLLNTLEIFELLYEPSFSNLDKCDINIILICRLV